MKKLFRILLMLLAVFIGLWISYLLGGCAAPRVQLLESCRVSNPYIVLQGRHDPGQELPPEPISQKIIVGTYEKIDD